MQKNAQFSITSASTYTPESTVYENLNFHHQYVARFARNKLGGLKKPHGCTTGATNIHVHLI